MWSKPFLWRRLMAEVTHGQFIFSLNLCHRECCNLHFDVNTSAWKISPGQCYHRSCSWVHVQTVLNVRKIADVGAFLSEGSYTKPALYCVFKRSHFCLLNQHQTPQQLNRKETVVLSQEVLCGESSRERWECNFPHPLLGTVCVIG